MLVRSTYIRNYGIVQEKLPDHANSANPPNMVWFGTGSSGTCFLPVFSTLNVRLRWTRDNLVAFFVRFFTGANFHYHTYATYVGGYSVTT
jgi:hypothetical protein